MMMLYIITFLQLLCGVFVCRSKEDNRSNIAQCRSKGFNGDTLQCSSCGDLTSFHLDNLIGDCQTCCVDDVMKSNDKKYSKAWIEICECNLARFPQVQAFVKSSMVDQWENRVSIRHVRGTLPTIKLLDSFGDIATIMNIEKWDTDTITEFLNASLER